VLEPRISQSAQKYVSQLDAATRKRIKDKIIELARDPFNIRISKPLRNSDKRSARVGSYRILFIVIPGDNVLLVSAVGPRNQIYREA
jgi:mRNA-degrading endonuclease RelE of RelBE toxin-antitoxin system